MGLSASTSNATEPILQMVSDFIDPLVISDPNSSRATFDRDILVEVVQKIINKEIKESGSNTSQFWLKLALVNRKCKNAVWIFFQRYHTLVLDETACLYNVRLRQNNSKEEQTTSDIILDESLFRSLMIRSLLKIKRLMVKSSGYESPIFNTIMATMFDSDLEKIILSNLPHYNEIDVQNHVLKLIHEKSTTLKELHDVPYSLLWDISKIPLNLDYFSACQIDLDEECMPISITAKKVELNADDECWVPSPVLRNVQAEYLSIKSWSELIVVEGNGPYPECQNPHIKFLNCEFFQAPVNHEPIVQWLNELHKAYANLELVAFKNSIDIISEKSRVGLEILIEAMNEYIKALEEVHELPFKISLKLSTFIYGSIETFIEDGTLVDFTHPNGYTRPQPAAEIKKAKRQVQVSPDKKVVVAIRKKGFYTKRDS